MKRLSYQAAAGYSLIELTIAMGILLAAISAAASLAMNTAQIEDINYRKGRVLAISEGAARLWQLGLSPGAAGFVMLGDPALASLTINGDPGDATSAIPSNQGTVIGDPNTDLGTFWQATIRARVRTFEGGADADPVTTDLPAILVIR
ncbi:MAG: hypothetical protein ACR2OZ_07340 [Verrucomicrobiales bacterium]